jgi:exoribonuclease II
MELGNVVEFIDSQKIICGVVLEKKNLRLRLLTEHNREVMIPAARLCHPSDCQLDIAMGRDKLVVALKEITARRRTLSEQIDIRALWEVLNSEQEWIDLTTMAAFSFPNEIGSDQVSAALRALFSERLYFKFSPERVFPHTVAQVEQMLAQHEELARQERLVNDGAAWLQRVEKSSAGGTPYPEADAIVEILAAYYLFDKQSPHFNTATAILKKAEISDPSAIFIFLVKIGHWQVHENLDLLHYQISPDFPEDVQSQAETLCRSAATATHGRRDLRDLTLMTIDGPSTLDFDDALSITKDQDHWLLGIHIADVGHYISRNDPIDTASMGRTSSIYMPDQKISMLPPQLSEDLCSLNVGQERPAISTLIRITPRAEVIDCQIVPSIVSVKHQLTFQKVDAMAADDEAIQTLHLLAQHYRERRLDNGALSIDLPEVSLWLDDAGRPNFTSADRAGIGRMLVAELMILANDMAARHLSLHNLPAIFRSQAEPRGRLFPRDKGTLFQNWMQRKLINRFRLGSTPEPHAGLGLPGYVTTTSPIRKYTDLVTQRQLRAAAGLEPPYTQEEMNAIIAALEEPLRQVGRIQYARQRYWLLKYLESHIGQKEEAIVLFKRRGGFVVLLTAYLLECPLSGAQGVSLKPEDQVRVILQHVNARTDAITVTFD